MTKKPRKLFEMAELRQSILTTKPSRDVTATGGQSMDHKAGKSESWEIEESISQVVVDSCLALFEADVFALHWWDSRMMMLRTCTGRPGQEIVRSVTLDS